MKGILLASASWLLVSFLLSLLVGTFIRGWRRKRLLRPDGVPRASAERQEPLADLRTYREKSRPPREDRVAPALRALAGKYGTRMKELEARMAETRHKLEILTEVSRLLAEEGLSDE